MDVSPLGKRKAPPAGAAAPPAANLKDDGAVSFSLVPDVCWQLISTFSAPPSVYNLALSSKHFFRPAHADAPGDGAAASLAAALASSTPVVATDLLRRSLLASLGRVLAHSKSGITLDAALEMPEGALIAGSTVAQACLGVVWEGKSKYGREEIPDVDVYCSAKAAPRVRSWLVESANSIFTGFHDTYIDIADSRLLYTVDTKIHHVESWGSIFQNFSPDLDEIDWRGEKTAEEANEEGAGITLEALKNTKHYKDMVKWGKNCQRTYVDWKWKNGMSFDVLGVDSKNKVYNIKPKPGGDLPFDFSGDGKIDLIVAKLVGKKEVTPSELLDDFDLTICKAAFDGKRFHIPDPHRTFSGQSTMEPNRRDIVESYVKHFVPPTANYLTPEQGSALAAATIKKVRKDVPRAPFFRTVDLSARFPEPREDDFLGMVNHWDPMVQAKMGGAIQFHNWTKKLIDRLRKYQGRGVEVVGAPTIADDFVIRQLSVCSHGG